MKKDNKNIFSKEKDNYFPSTSDFSLSFTVKGFGYVEKETKKYPYTFVRKDLESFHFVIEGSGYLETNGKVQKVNKGDFFLLRNGSNTMYYSSPNDPWTCVWVDFSYHSQLNNLYKILNIKDNIGRFEDMKCLIDTTNYLLDNRNKFDSLFINTKLLETIYSIAIKPVEITSPKIEKNQEEDIANMVLLYIDNNFRNHDLTVASISKKFSYTHEHLTRLFNKKYGINIITYINQIRMEEAEALLINKTPVTKVADLTGFSSVSYFSKAFKKYFGKSPKDCYRAKLIG